MNSYSVHIDRDCVHDFHDGKEYGHWENEYVNTFQGVTKGDPKSYADIQSTLSFAEGDKGYVVWVEYSSGDSFGHGTRNDVSALAVFKDREAAGEFARAVEAHNTDEHGYTMKLITSDGQNHEVCASWCGYFEHLDEVHVDEFVMGNHPKKSWWRR
jgi:hypothetical protein